MTDIVQQTLSKWANEKWPVYGGQITQVTTNLGVRHGGYCETCEYTYSVVEFSLYGKNHKHLGEEYIEGDLASFLNEILGGTNG